MLQGISILEFQDREYLMNVFREYESGGITKGEVKKVITWLLKETIDNLSATEIREVRRTLLQHL